ncbi:hypothetical protein [Mycolicibacterium austroafricanum]|uniref:hypothetical protein n=1 Tax=Mycolicibacterium austroafricanum TaxID=39687 RepID=UPI001CA318E4|nr:hypothetical protein [Mycolicibacterium austroafricanum]QZT59877.1 hypothetical protein JN084_08585 [Mycolicibacterium austroafricanum]
MLGSVGLGAAPSAWADDVVTYEVVSDRVAVAHVSWQDTTGRRFAYAALPWRADVAVREPLGPPPHGSQVRADWLSSAYPGNWVTVRILYRGRVICQNTLDLGNATCYGITPRIT